MKLTRTQRMLGAAVVAGSLLSGPACGSRGDGAASEEDWRGTVTTEGDVTTVVNESGSVWGGTATLVEEASIGVETGDDEYMFGNVEGVALTGDHLYVLDRSVPVIRVYDRQGNHVRDMGRGGQGPGEFDNPYLLAVSPDGRTFVRTLNGLVVFERDGEHLMTLNERGGLILPMVATPEGAVYMPVDRAGPAPGGHVLVRPDGSRGDFIERPTAVDWEPWALMARGNGRMMQQTVPYAPTTVSTLTPSGAMVHGRSDEYRIQIDRTDGTGVVIRRSVMGIPVQAAERAWHEELMQLRMRQLQTDWSWNANPIPDTKPFFSRLYVDAGDTLWVRRILRTEQIAECDADLSAAIEQQRMPRPCFREIEGFDVFGPDGRFQGSVELPPVRLREQPAIDADRIVLAIEDEAGTIVVKLYQLVLPGASS